MASLRHYKAKRDFRSTPEPAGGKRRGNEKLSFVVQKHAARRLHYDFRLEHGGVLWSWAVPKGPSQDPRDRRLAVRTEDHPLEYADFEGVIPSKHYGAGTVEIWDRGTWKPEGDPSTSLRSGHLTFFLDGTRLHGRFHLERIRDSNASHENWLLIKSRGDDKNGIAPARAPKPAPPALAPTHRWRRAGARESNAANTQLATLVSTPPAGDDWIHETKFDGYRALLRIAKGRCRVITRGAHDWTSKFEKIASAAGALKLRDAVVDGEIVAIDSDGRSSFQLLQAALAPDARPGIVPVYYAFDLLELDGDDLRALPLLERKRKLARIWPSRRSGVLRYSDHVVGQGAATFREACRLGLEGIVSKRADSLYRSGRGTDWQKSKCIRRQEFVIGGFTDPKGSREGFGAILVGVTNGDELVFCGKVGTGFDDKTIRAVAARLKKLETSKPPFATPPREHGVHWTKPGVVCEVAFSEWTRDGRLRHPSFQALREDKDWRSVVRETPRDATGIENAKSSAPTAKRAKRPLASDAESAIAAITHPDKILYPRTGTTKGDLAAYLEAVAPRMLPYVADRPLSLVRCPGGVAAKCFYQKHLDGEEFITVDDAAGLVGLVQLGVLEIHTWGAKRSAIERPDVMVFDLDPAPDVSFAAVVATAKKLRELLEKKHGLRTFAKLTGGKGVHVVVPNDPDHDWDTHKRVAKAISDQFAGEDPEHRTTNPRKSARAGRIFIDYLRNGRGATAIAPYSPRARAEASVAIPIAWKDLTTRLKPNGITFEEAIRHARGKDPWQGYPV